MFTDYTQPILMAITTTLLLAVCSLIIGIILALIFTVLESNKYKIIRIFCSGLTILLRGLPEILVVFLIYFGSSQLFFIIVGKYIEFSGFWCGTIALALVFASYASQTLRGAIQAIPIGQRESGQALGLSNRYIFIQIILPQVWRHALPGLNNQWLVLLKDTALVSLIGVNDILRQADYMDATLHKPFAIYCSAALFYLTVTVCSRKILQKLEQHHSFYETAGD